MSSATAATGGGCRRALRIEFQSPLVPIRGSEMRSKLLKRGSELHTFLTLLRREIDTFAASRSEDRPLHIELLARNEDRSDATLTQRASLLEGMVIDLNYQWYDGALVVCVGPVGGCAHITIHHYGNRLSYEMRSALMTATQECDARVRRMMGI